MFLDLAWSEIVLIAVVTVVFVGPKDLPRVLNTTGKWMRRAKMVARDFQSTIDEMAREAELDDIRKQAAKFGQTSLEAQFQTIVADQAATNALPAPEPPLIEPPADPSLGPEPHPEAALLPREPASATATNPEPSEVATITAPGTAEPAPPPVPHEPHNA